MKIFPKLNIFLNVLSPRADGLHPIFSRFVLARGGLYDEMEILFHQERFQIVGDFDFPTEKNLIFKAKEKLKESFPHLANELEGVRVEVKKNIPQGSGLGGGSANAGVFLLEMGKEFGISKRDLMQVASSVGADVSFFVSEYESANVSGVGDVIEEFVEPNHYEFEIFTPPIFCETSAVYRAFDEFSSRTLPRLDFLSLSSIDLLYGYGIEELNELYLPACKIYPHLLEVARELGEGWCLSGSGSSFFRIKR